MSVRIDIGKIKGKDGTILYQHKVSMYASTSEGSKLFYSVIKSPVQEPLTLENALTTHKDFINNEVARGSVFGAFSGGFYDDNGAVFDFDGIELTSGDTIYADQFKVESIVDTVTEL